MDISVEVTDAQPIDVDVSRGLQGPPGVASAESPLVLDGDVLSISGATLGTLSPADGEVPVWDAGTSSWATGAGGGSGTARTDEEIQDVTASLVAGGTNLTVTYDDAAGALTLDAPSALSAFTNDVGYITDYTVTQSDVTQHEAALSITESQITDLTHFSGSFTDLTDVPSLVEQNNSATLSSITVPNIDSAVFGGTTTAGDFPAGLSVHQGKEQIGLAVRRSSAGAYSYFEMYNEIGESVFRLNENAELLMGSHADTGMRRESKGLLELISSDIDGTARGSLLVTQVSADSILLTSSGGTQYKVTVADDGTLQTTAV